MDSPGVAQRKLWVEDHAVMSSVLYLDELREAKCRLRIVYRLHEHGRVCRMGV